MVRTSPSTPRAFFAFNQHHLREHLFSRSHHQQPTLEVRQASTFQVAQQHLRRRVWQPQLSLASSKMATSALEMNFVRLNPLEIESLIVHQRTRAYCSSTLYSIPYRVAHRPFRERLCTIIHSIPLRIPINNISTSPITTTLTINITTTTNM